jgi:hypothetical protein
MATRIWQTIAQRLDRAGIRFVCLAVLILSLVLLGISFATADRGATMFGPPLGADFAGFYTAGMILNQPEPGNRDRLYDIAYHDELYHALLPRLQETEKLPYVHPPFVAVVFSYLARLPYEWAFAIWLPIAAGLYVAGFSFTWRALQPPPALDWKTALLLVLSFEPFIMECWLGGQLSAVGFFWIALAFACERAHRPIAAGMALGCCLYKPTLLVLLLPMLVVARRFRMLAGFTATGLVLAGISLGSAGQKNCRDFLQVLFGFARTTTGSSQTLTSGSLELRLWKYVDLNSFFRLLFGGHSAWSWGLILVIAAVPLVFLAKAWWRLDRLGDAHRCLTWAATLTWTLVLNLYVGVYDTILSCVAALLTADILSRRQVDRAPPLPAGFQFLLLLLYVAPWVSQPLARTTGVQGYTLVLMVMAGYQLALAERQGTELP